MSITKESIQTSWTYQTPPDSREPGHRITAGVDVGWEAFLSDRELIHYASTEAARERQFIMARDRVLAYIYHDIAQRVRRLRSHIRALSALAQSASVLPDACEELLDEIAAICIGQELPANED